MTSPVLDEDQQVYITGNLKELGSWYPANILMEYAGQHTWVKEISISGPARVEYKFTLGAWEREGADASFQPLRNFTADIGSDTLFHDTILFWTNRKPPQLPEHSVLGRAEYWPQMKGKGLCGRDVIVWLPPGYEDNTDDKYPVIYLQDGQNAFDSYTSAFGNEWRVDESIDSMVKKGTIPPLIAVGIYNTPDRSAEYLPGDTAGLYMDFIVNHLKPFIDSAYRSLPGPEHTITCGSSAGGTISFMLVWEHPEVFSKGICMSPAFRIESIDYVSAVEATTVKRDDVFLYMDIGGKEIEEELRLGILDMVQTLTEKGYKAGKDFIFIEDPGAFHNEKEWAKRFPEALLRCMENPGP